MLSITYAIDYEDYDDDDEYKQPNIDVLTIIVSALFGAVQKPQMQFNYMTIIIIQGIFHRV